MQHSTKPFSLSRGEWEEITNLPIIRELWGLSDETAEEFAGRVYGAKFDFQSGAPGYSGDLYVLQGDALTGDAPVVLVRDDKGRLRVINQSL